MNKVDVVCFIRDEMLCDPNVEADLVWKVTNMAEYDPAAYLLVSRWMETNSKPLRMVLTKTMKRFINGV